MSRPSIASLEHGADDPVDAERARREARGRGRGTPRRGSPCARARGAGARRATVSVAQACRPRPRRRMRRRALRSPTTRTRGARCRRAPSTDRGRVARATRRSASGWRSSVVHSAASRGPAEERRDAVAGRERAVHVEGRDDGRRAGGGGGTSRSRLYTRSVSDGPEIFDDLYLGLQAGGALRKQRRGEELTEQEREAIGRWQQMSMWRKGVAIGAFAVGTFGLGFTARRARLRPPRPQSLTEHLSRRARSPARRSGGRRQTPSRCRAVASA